MVVHLTWVPRRRALLSLLRGLAWEESTDHKRQHGRGWLRRGGAQGCDTGSRSRMSFYSNNNRLGGLE